MVAATFYNTMEAIDGDEEVDGRGGRGIVHTHEDAIRLSSSSTALRKTRHETLPCNCHAADLHTSLRSVPTSRFEESRGPTDGDLIDDRCQIYRLARISDSGLRRGSRQTIADVLPRTCQQRSIVDNGSRRPKLRRSRDGRRSRKWDESWKSKNKRRQDRLWV